MMFSTQGSIASRTFDFDFSEMVVVGHVPLNRKRGQRQLQRIAKQNEAVPERRAPERRERPDRKDRAPKAQKPKPQPKERTPAQPRAAPAHQQPKERTPQPKERTQQPRSVPKMTPEPQRKAVPKIVVGSSAVAVPLCELPAETLAHVGGLAGYAAIGSFVATGRAAHTALWAGSARAFWRGLGADGWNHARVLRFGLTPGWTLRLEAQADAEPLEALAFAVAACGALLCSEFDEAACLKRVLCAASKGAGALPLLDAALPKLEQPVFGCLATVRQARDEACERAILAEIDQQQQRDHEALAFDYFEEPEPALPAPAAFWDELEALTPKASLGFFEAEEAEDGVLEAEETEEAPGIPEAESRALAAEFLEAMGLRHGFAWQETAAAMTAVEA